MMELAKLPAWAPVDLSPENLFRSVAVVLRTGTPWSVDPGPSLSHPGPEAGHEAFRVLIPRGEAGHIPAWWLVPKGHQGKALLFLHGTSAHSLSPFFRLLEAKLAAGFAVLFPELDGHGDNPEALHPDRLHEVGPAAWAWLKAQPGVRPEALHLSGMSVGAACAVRLAAEAEAQGQPFRSLVLFSPPTRLHFDDWARTAEALGLLNPENLDILPRATPDRLLGFLTEPIRVACGHDGSVLHSDELNPRLLVGLNWAVKALDPLGAAAGLKTPLCVIGGRWDNLTPLYQMVDHYARAAGPKSLHLLPRRNHFTLMTSHRAVAASLAWAQRWS